MAFVGRGSMHAVGGGDRLIAPANPQIQPVFAIDGQAMRDHRPAGRNCCTVLCCCGEFRVPGLPIGSTPILEEDKPAILSKWEGVWFPKIIKTTGKAAVPHPAFMTFTEVSIDTTTNTMLLTGGNRNVYRGKQNVSVPNEARTQPAWPNASEALKPVVGYLAPNGDVLNDNAGVKKASALSADGGEVTFTELQIQGRCCCWHTCGGTETLLQRGWKRAGELAPPAAQVVDGVVAAAPVVDAVVASVAAGVAPQVMERDPIEAIRQLKLLLDDGTLTQSEFDLKKSELLSRV
jgi:hypothetical protein